MNSRNSFTHRLLTAILISAASLCVFADFASRAILARHGQDKSRQLVQEDTKGAPAQSERRVALVIGNSTYRHVPVLANPSNDARDMSDALRRLGFDVLSGLDLSEEEMKRAIKQFGERLRRGGVGLFYYAGHGIQIGGRNYMIPIEALDLRESTIEFEAVDVNRVLGEMDAAGNRLNIIILDACRTNPFQRNWRSGVAEGLAPIDAPAGTLIAYATRPNDVASDGVGRNGLYTEELLREMLVPGLTIEEVLKRVRVSVQRKTNNKQVPWEASSLTGDFRFMDRPYNNSADAELRMWESIKNSDRVEDFNQYLAKYPGGAYSDMARQRLTAIRNAESAAAEKPTPTQPANVSRSPSQMMLIDKHKHAFIIEYGMLEGEEAFTFYVFHLHGAGAFMKFHRGKLTITRTRIAFQPDNTSKCEHAFNLARNEVKEIKVTTWGGIKNWGGEQKHILIKIDGRPNMNFESSCFRTPESDKKGCDENVEVLNFFSQILTDYDRAVQDFQRRRTSD